MIAIILSRAEGGGLESVMSSIALALAERGLDCRVVAGKVVHPSGLGVQLEEIAPESPLILLARLPRWTWVHHPNVLMTSSNDVACFTLMFRRFWRHRPAVIVTQHLSISGPLHQARGLNWLKLRLLRCLMRWLYPRADARVAVSKAVADDMVRELGVAPDSIDVIHNPVLSDCDAEIPSLRADVWPWPDRGAPVLVFAGRLSPEKRPDLLMDAFDAVRSRWPCRLLMLGDGPLAAELRARHDASEWKHDIALVGRVDAVLPWMANSDLLVLPSDYEGFGNVLVEAMHAGLQIVATDCPSGPREVLDDGRHGRLVPVGDLSALIGAIEDVLDGRFHVDPQLQRQRAAEFTVEPAVERYAAIIQSLKKC